MVHFDAKLTGTVEDMSLADLLQLFHYARKSVTLHVSGYRGGSVVMVDGEIHHAASTELEGEDALAALLAQKLVRVRTCAATPHVPRTVQRSFGAVLLDLLRQRDEWARDTGDLPVPERVPDEDLVADFEPLLKPWVERRPDIEHGAIIDPRAHYVLACDSPRLWANLVQTLMMQTLVAPYFDDAFEEIDGLLPALSGRPPEDRQTVVTFSGRHYVLDLLPQFGWLAVLIFRASNVSHGLALTHMVSFRQAIEAWSAKRPARVVNA